MSLYCLKSFDDFLLHLQSSPKPLLRPIQPLLTAVGSSSTSAPLLFILHQLPEHAQYAVPWLPLPGTLFLWIANFLPTELPRNTSDGKVFACNVGDLGSISGMRNQPGRGWDAVREAPGGTKLKEALPLRVMQVLPQVLCPSSKCGFTPYFVFL